MHDRQPSADGANGDRLQQGRDASKQHRHLDEIQQFRKIRRVRPEAKARSARNDGIRPPEDYPTQAVDRGGGLTWHGPGQIVCYPVFKWGLRKEEASVAEIITKIEQWVIDALRLLNINGVRDQRMQGVWVDGHKICSIGLSFLRWVSRHGFTVNVNTPPGRVESVAGCGLTKDTTTSLANLGYEVDGQAVKQALLDAMQFGPVIGS